MSESYSNPLQAVPKALNFQNFVDFEEAVEDDRIAEFLRLEPNSVIISICNEIDRY